MSENLGPLPKHDDNAVLEERSFAKFRAAVPAHMFIIRDERIVDRGVDASLELCVEGCATNFRSQIQVKATHRANINADGSWSLQIDRSNLNYLLNGTSPFFVLWAEDRNELRYVWARDEAHRLLKSPGSQRTEQTINIRFSHPLSDTAWAEITARVIREGRLQREIHDRLAQTANQSELSISITTPDLQTTDARQAYEFLKSAGMALVNGGHLTKIDNLTRLLSPKFADDPKIQLILGFNDFVRGDWISASSHCAKAAIRAGDFSDADQHFLKVVKSASDYHSGRISYENFLDVQKQVIDTAPCVIALQLKIGALRRMLLCERHQLRREQGLQELRSLIQDLANSPEATDNIRLEIELVRIFAEGISANLEFLRAVFGYKIQEQVDAAIDKAQVASRLNQAIAAVRQNYIDIEAVIQQTEQLRRPLLYAEALLTRIILLSAKVSFAYATSIRYGKGVPTLPPEMDEIATKDLNTVIEISRNYRSVEKELRALMLLADWHEFFGRTSASQEIAIAEVGTARAMGYDGIAKSFEDHISGNTRFRQIISAVNSNSEPDDILLEATDEQLSAFAIDWLDAMAIPRDRLPIIENEVQCMRAVAREKHDWCRHLRIEQILDHMQSRSTMYSREPIRSCVCEKFGVRSKIEDPDWEVILGTFKGVYCRDCIDRSPKNAS